MLSSILLPILIFLSRLTPALQRAGPVCPGDDQKSGVEMWFQTAAPAPAAFLLLLSSSLSAGHKSLVYHGLENHPETVTSVGTCAAC